MRKACSCFLRMADGRCLWVLICRPVAVEWAVRAHLWNDLRVSWEKFGRWARDSVKQDAVKQGAVKQDSVRDLVKEWIGWIF